jgi:hypothetical protein
MTSTSVNHILADELLTVLLCHRHHRHLSLRLIVEVNEIFAVILLFAVDQSLAAVSAWRVSLFKQHLNRIISQTFSAKYLCPCFRFPKCE